MEGKYQAYPEYKNSGVEWISTMPINWEKVRLNAVCSFQKGYGLSKGDISENGSSPCILYGELYTVYKDVNEIKNITSNTNVNSGYESEGDEILIPASTTTTGIDLANANYLPHKGVKLGGDIIILRPRREYNKKFVSYFITNVNKREFVRNSKGVTIYHIYASSIKNMPVFLPSTEEQNKIVRFLEYETAKIDTLIEKQQRLIELLKEKRQAVISHAVTKGLNPDAPMRDSGVEWLGEVPVHWTIPKIAHVGRVFNGSTPDKNNLLYWENGTISWLASSCLNYDVIDEPTMLITEGAYKNSSLEMVPPGSILVGLVGQGKTRGNSAILNIEACINQNMAAVVPNIKVLTKYLFYIFRAMYEDLRELGRGGNQAALNCEIISSLRIPLPSPEEQKEIVSHVDAITHKTTETIRLAQKQIGLLSERRTALISAAVTGEIDVRGWKAPDPEKDKQVAA